MRADRPHLLVALVDGIVRVGPFVVPGRTACLRCIDAHHTERDPRRSLVLHQYAASRAPRIGVPDPVPHDLLDLALVWAVRDLVAWIDGRRPRCWSATVRVEPDLELAVTPWPATRAAAAPGAGCRDPARAAEAGHHHSLSSLDSIARRCSREHVSQKTRLRPFSTAVVQVSGISSTWRPQKSHVAAISPP